MDDSINYRRIFTTVCKLTVGMIMLIIFIAPRMSFKQSETTDSTKMKGVVINQYFEGYKYHRSYYESASTKRKRDKEKDYYIDVKYTYNGEEKTAERLRANFWETPGSTIHFYLTSEGNTFRNSYLFYDKPLELFMDIGGILLISAVMILACLKKLGKFGIFVSRKEEPVGVVINDYDIPLDGPKEKMQQADSSKESSPNNPQRTSAFEASVSINAESENATSQSSELVKPEFQLYTEEEYKKQKKNSLHTADTLETQSKSGLNLHFKDE